MSNISPRQIRSTPSSTDATPRPTRGGGGPSIKAGLATSAFQDGQDAQPMEAYTDYYAAFKQVYWNSGGWDHEGIELVCTEAGMYSFVGQAQSFGNASSQHSLDILVGPQGVFAQQGTQGFPGVLVGRSLHELPEGGGSAVLQTTGLYPCAVGDRVRLRYTHTSTPGRQMLDQTWLEAVKVGSFVLPFIEIPGF